MDRTNKKIYLGIEQDNDNDVINGDDPRNQERIKQLLKDLAEHDKKAFESQKLWNENFDNEVLEFRKKAVEAKTLFDLSKLSEIVETRISFFKAKQLSDENSRQNLKELKAIRKSIKASIKVIELNHPVNEFDELTYERLFKDPKECERITNIILEQACKDGVFNGFEEAKPAKQGNQLKITYEIIAGQYLKKIYSDPGKGLIEAAKQKFFERFKWLGYRGKRPDKPNCVDITKPIKNSEFISHPNKNAIREIELILSKK